MTTDLISDMLTRIRNATLAKHNFAILQFSEPICQVLKVFTKEGYILGYTVIKNPKQKIKVFLRYKGSWIKTSFISEIKRISKPGRRIYSSYNSFFKFVKPLNYNQGIALISTSSGIMNHKKALYYKKGGEIICYLK